MGVTAFLPIGDYRKGALANVAKHRGALGLFGTLTWIKQTWGLHVSNTVGFTFNQENRATRYKSGTEFHWEWSIAKKFESVFSIGPAGYFYNQLTGDAGVGTKLGSFEGQVWAVGAGIGYEFKFGVLPVTARLRYFRELQTKHRLKGDTAHPGDFTFSERVSAAAIADDPGTVRKRAGTTDAWRIANQDDGWRRRFPGLRPA